MSYSSTCKQNQGEIHQNKQYLFTFLLMVAINLGTMEYLHMQRMTTPSVHVVLLKFKSPCLDSTFSGYRKGALLISL